MSKGFLLFKKGNFQSFCLIFIFSCSFLFIVVSKRYLSIVGSSLRSLNDVDRILPLDYIRNTKNVNVPSNSMELYSFQHVEQKFTNVKEIQCYKESSTVRPQDCGCLEIPNKYNSYFYELKSTLNKISIDELINETIFVFIHLNKAGGTTVKKELLFQASERFRWDGAAIGSFKGWKYVKEVGHSAVPINKHKLELHSQQYAVNEPRYLSCGVGVPNNQITYLANHKPACSLRFLWGALSLGLCDLFPDKSCVYFTVLRHPLERAFSSYNYVCVQGAEHKKKWPAEWKETGHCPLNITQYFRSGYLDTAPRLANPNLILERLSHSCNSNSEASVEIAKKNLFNPCVRYLLLDKFDDGLNKLNKAFGYIFEEEITKMLKYNDRKNRSPYPSRVEDQQHDPEVVSELEKMMKADLDIYHEAEAKYELQWAQPLSSCNWKNKLIG